MTALVYCDKLLEMTQIISSDIKGHDLIQNQIYQALNSERFPHALLFSGPSGVGKRKMAWVLAQSLLCEKTSFQPHPDHLNLFQDQDSKKDYSPCGKCFSCVSLLKRQSENVLCITHETLQIRLKEVQIIPAFLSLQSFAKAKIVLIDSAEKLNLQASNFLLKIVEEPPPKSFFFFISSQPAQIPLTIRSRLQNISFSALSEELLAKLSPQETKAWMIRGARGRLDVLEDLKDQQDLRNFAFDLFQKIFKENSFIKLDFKQKIKSRKQALDITRFFLEFLRDIRLLKLGGRDYIIHGDKISEMNTLTSFSSSYLDLWIKKAIEMEQELSSNFDLVLCFENFMISIKQSLRESF